MEYNFKQIESKWQNVWYTQNTFAAKQDFSLPKYYCLVEFPYPSGQGLHVGHPRSYTALDIVARKKRLEGYNVLYPMGWDAFGLPTENFAIKNHIHPAEVTKNNVAHFKQQLQSLGFSFDWTREINTTDPSYYKWTQWIFLQLFKKGQPRDHRLASLKDQRKRVSSFGQRFERALKQLCARFIAHYAVIRHVAVLRQVVIKAIPASQIAQAGRGLDHDR